jgi:transposase InsO family protein
VTRPCIPHECKGATPIYNTSELSPYPGHSLFQESFFFCKIKNVGDDPGAGDIYVETAVDGNCRLAFARVYSAQNAMNAVDLLKTRVLPFFEHYGIPIERVFTPKRNEYFGLAPAHPFETFLSTSQIRHLEIDRYDQTAISLCEQFFHVLQQDFFSAALRKRFHQSLELLQKDLDAFVETYNCKRTGLGDDPQVPPLRAFQDALKVTP